MGLIATHLQRILSGKLGVPVRIDDVSVSILGGSAEARGVAVGAGASCAIVSVDHVKARLAVGRMLKREFVVRELSLHRPIVRIVRDRGGAWNIPTKRREAATSDVVTEPPTTSPSDDDAQQWSLAAERVLILDGEVHLELRTEDPPYTIAVRSLLANLMQRPGGYDATILAETLLGQMKGSARIDGIDDLSRVMEASVEADLRIGELMSVRVRSPRIAERALSFDVNGSGDFAMLSGLLPPSVQDRVRGLRGTVRFELRGSVSAESALTIDAFNLSGEQIAVNLKR